MFKNTKTNQLDKNFQPIFLGLPNSFMGSIVEEISKEEKLEKKYNSFTQIEIVFSPEFFYYDKKR